MDDMGAMKEIYRATVFCQDCGDNALFTIVDGGGRHYQCAVCDACRLVRGEDGYRDDPRTREVVNLKVAVHALELRNTELVRWQEKRMIGRAHV